MAVDMSCRLGWIDDSLVKRVYNIFQVTKLPTAPPESMTVDMFKSVMAVRKRQSQTHATLINIHVFVLGVMLLYEMQVDKKVADGLLRLILLKGPVGSCVFTGEYDRQALDDTLRAFCKS